MAVRTALLVVSITFLASCGGGGSSAGLSSSPGTVPGIDSLVVTGAASKSPIIGATVELFEIDDHGFPVSAPVAATTTNANGGFTVSLSTVSGPLLVKTSGGSFVDESDQNPDPEQRRKIALSSDEGLLSLLPQGADTVAVTPYTHAMVHRARFDSSGNFLDVFAAANARLTEQTGFDVFTTIPANPIAPASAATSAQMQYGLLLGAVANVANNAAIQMGLPVPDFEVIRGVIDDLADGRLDGSFFGDPIQVHLGERTVEFPRNIDFDAELIRFRNNNFAAFQSTTVPAIDGDALFNLRPTANAGEDQTVPALSAVALSAIESTDSDGSIESFNWRQLSGPAVTLSDADTASPRYTPSATLATSQEFVFELTVTDDKGGIDVDTVIVVVEPALPQAVFAVELRDELEFLGNDIDGGARIEVNPDGTGRILSDEEEIFTWSEADGVLTFDFGTQGGSTDEFTTFNEEGDELHVTETTEFLELELVSSNEGRLRIGFRDVGNVQTFNVTENVLGQVEPFEESGEVILYDPLTALPLPTEPGRMVLPTDVGAVQSGLIDRDELFPDILTFNVDGSGFADLRGLHFTWTRDSSGVLSVDFSGVERADYYLLEQRSNGDLVFVDYTLHDGTQVSTAYRSFVGTDQWADIEVPGRFATIGLTSDTGPDFFGDFVYNMRPDGTGVAEYTFFDGPPLLPFSDGGPFPFQSTAGICWMIDTEGNLLTYRTTVGLNSRGPQVRTPSVSTCENLVFSDVSFGFIWHLVKADNGKLRLISEQFSNECESSDSFCSEFAVTNIRTGVVDHTSYSGNPPVLVGDFPEVFSADGSVVFDVLANDIEGDSPIVPGTLRILGDGPMFGTTSIDPVTHEITYTAGGSSSAQDFFAYTVNDEQGNQAPGGFVFLSLSPMADAGPFRDRGRADKMFAERLLASLGEYLPAYLTNVSSILIDSWDTTTTNTATIGTSSGVDVDWARFWMSGVVLGRITAALSSESGYQ